MDLHQHQQNVARSRARFKITRGGRRSGKTVLKTETMIFKATSNLVQLARNFPDKTVIFIAPTQKQARTIIWESLKARLHGVATFNESRLEARLPTESGGKATIMVGGWENRENYRGMSNVTHIEFDEVDTMKDFFIGWEEIFKPMLMETGGSAGFGGTPKKENPNLRRLEKEAELKEDWGSFHFSSWDNPGFSRKELEKARDEMDAETYRQEIMAEYVDNAGALFRYTSLVDMFSNTITKNAEKYLIIDVADDGTDKTVFSFWEGLEMYRLEQFARLNTESIIDKTREFAAAERIPYSQIAVDAIGVGAGVASSLLLDGIIGYKSSYGAIRTDEDPTKLPNVHYTKEAKLTSDYLNLRSQCVFTLAELVNNHKIAIRIGDLRAKEEIIEELALCQDASKGDGKRMATPKDDIKALLGRSPDKSDTLLMRMYFEIRGKLVPGQSEDAKIRAERVKRLFKTDNSFKESNSTK
jgi:Terminase large subunit, T4likevirus-type, N-terminal